MFAFELGREYKLSIAEIYALFPKMKIVYFNEKILLVNNINEDGLLKIAKNIGGTIKIIRIENKIPLNPFIKEESVGVHPIIKSEKTIENSEGQKQIYDYLSKFFIKEKKNNYSINTYGCNKINQKDLLLKSKKYFQKSGFSSRFVNPDFNNIKSYQIIKEKLIESKTDFNIISTNIDICIGITIFVQDIDSYTKRDFGKKRDMQIGMLPPKLAQMMINLSRTENGELRTEKIEQNPPIPLYQGGNYLKPITISNKLEKLSTMPYTLTTIYDPFCGLGTILLESIIAGNNEVYGSDINQDMINTTIKNIEFIKNEFTNNLKKYEIIKLDAKDVVNSPILKNHNITTIITEGYLGEIFGKNNIDLEKVKKQRKALGEIYKSFFSGLKQIYFKGNIVISFPFWEVKGKYNYFEEIYEIIGKYCEIINLLPKNIDLKPSKSGSLLYKRPDQTVGREIFKLRIK